MPKAPSPCDCLVEVDDVDMTPSGIQTKYVIRYCDYHNRAPLFAEMLAAVKKLHIRIGPSGKPFECGCEICDLIRRAEKETK